MLTGKKTFPYGALQRERLIVLCGLLGLSLLAWAYIILMAGDASAGTGTMEMAMPLARGWGLRDAVITFAMWSVMMFAMMTPSAAPMILAFEASRGPTSGSERTISSTAAFLVGYLVVWTLFSAGATVMQWLLQSASMLTDDLLLTRRAGGAVLLIAGVFQFSPLKNSCLSVCRSPVSFLLAEWREGVRGAFVMGTRHGLYCLGCCWAIMLLLFAVGVMNLLWVAGIAIFVLLEKTLLPGRLITSLGGVSLITAGLFLLA
ncbi:MAG: DUF2182 domain-containing protein [Gemmatimonadaceae bacterium]|nr:DUF2182 domain-containing protein [Gemmatimonadaceae bacterium]